MTKYISNHNVNNYICNLIKPNTDVTSYKKKLEIYNSLFKDLQEHTLNKSDLEYIHRTKNFKKENNVQDLSIKKTNTPQKILKRNRSDFFYPMQEDSLFWCFFIMMKGMFSYEFIGKNYFSIEKEFKINSISALRENKQIIKQYKIKLVDVENDLINEKKITVSTMIALCLLHNINVFYIKNKLYYQLNVSSEKKMFVINYDSDKNKYGINIDCSEEKIITYKNEKLEIETISKPIRAFSAYKVKDLTDMCEKLSIKLFNNDKKKTKKELYEDILKCIS